MSVSLRFQPTLSASAPVVRLNFDDLRIVDEGGLPYDMLPGDEIVAIQKGEEEDEITRIEVVLNFFEELKQKMRAAGAR